MPKIYFLIEGDDPDRLLLRRNKNMKEPIGYFNSGLVQVHVMRFTPNEDYRFR